MIKELLAKMFGSRDEKDLYNWKELYLNDLEKIPDGLNDMRIRNFDGILLKNVFTPEECDTIVENFNNVPQDRKKVMPEGEAYPLVFAQLVRAMKFDNDFTLNEDKFESYFKTCQTYNQTFESDFHVPFKERMEEIFKKISGGRGVALPAGMGGIGEYPFSTIRKLIPNQGNVSIHCGNYFQQEFPDFYKHLKSQVEVKDQLSYFLMLQDPEEGGELTLYDWIWKDGQTKDNPAENTTVVDEKGKNIDVSSLQTVKIRPKKGDIILFQGGAIWHRVEHVRGKKSRYTIGGFLGFSENNQNILYWS